MAKLLFWVLIGFAAYMAWRWWQVKQIAASRDEGKAAGDAARAGGPEAMVPCDVCGLNVPRSEALADKGRFYCSDEHRRRGGL